MGTPHRSGGGGDMTGSQSGSFEKRESQSIRPLTIKQVLAAEASKQTDGNFSIDGHPIALISLIALLRNRDRQSSYYSFLLDDATGSVEAQLWVNDADPENRDAQINEIPLNSYVRIYGQIRVFNNTSRVTVIHIQPVTDRNEITMHMLETVYAHLFFTRGSTQSGNNGAAVGKSGFNENPFGAAAGSQLSTRDVIMNEARNYSPLQSSVINFITSRDSETGPHINDVVSHVNQSEGAVRQVIGWLIDEGRIYNTIDEDHFRAMPS
ncbi:hypothetical protein BDF22DRAFT_685340 [Syncephalis plumigaleata]|nr:hypothetical protein BDF22DRAFT_685340 [Syncephalis plumigaleata]